MEEPTKIVVESRSFENFLIHFINSWLFHLFFKNLFERVRTKWQRNFERARVCKSRIYSKNVQFSDLFGNLLDITWIVGGNLECNCSNDETIVSNLMEFFVFSMSVFPLPIVWCAEIMIFLTYMGSSRKNETKKKTIVDLYVIIFVRFWICWSSP